MDEQPTKVVATKTGNHLNSGCYQNPLFIKLCIPEGLEEVLEGLAREVLRRQPSNISRFAAVYFAKLLAMRTEAENGGIEMPLKSLISRGRFIDFDENELQKFTEKKPQVLDFKQKNEDESKQKTSELLANADSDSRPEDVSPLPQEEFPKISSSMTLDEKPDRDTPDQEENAPEATSDQPVGTSEKERPKVERLLSNNVNEEAEDATLKTNEEAEDQTGSDSVPTVESQLTNEFDEEPQSPLKPDEDSQQQHPSTIVADSQQLPNSVEDWQKTLEPPENDAQRSMAPGTDSQKPLQIDHLQHEPTLDEDLHHASAVADDSQQPLHLVKESQSSLNPDEDLEQPLDLVENMQQSSKNDDDDNKLLDEGPQPPLGHDKDPGEPLEPDDQQESLKLDEDLQEPLTQVEDSQQASSEQSLNLAEELQDSLKADELQDSSKADALQETLKADDLQGSLRPEDDAQHTLAHDEIIQQQPLVGDEASHQPLIPDDNLEPSRNQACEDLQPPVTPTEDSRQLANLVEDPHRPLDVGEDLHQPLKSDDGSPDAPAHDEDSQQPLELDDDLQRSSEPNESLQDPAKSEDSPLKVTLDAEPDDDLQQPLTLDEHSLDSFKPDEDPQQPLALKGNGPQSSKLDENAQPFLKPDEISRLIIKPSEDSESLEVFDTDSLQPVKTDEFELLKPDAQQLLTTDRDAKELQLEDEDFQDEELQRLTINEVLQEPTINDDDGDHVQQPKIHNIESQEPFKSNDDYTQQQSEMDGDVDDPKLALDLDTQQDSNKDIQTEDQEINENVPSTEIAPLSMADGQSEDMAELPATNNNDTKNEEPELQDETVLEAAANAIAASAEDEGVDQELFAEDEITETSEAKAVDNENDERLRVDGHSIPNSESGNGGPEESFKAVQQMESSDYTDEPLEPNRIGEGQEPETKDTKTETSLTITEMSDDDLALKEEVEESTSAQIGLIDEPDDDEVSDDDDEDFKPSTAAAALDSITEVIEDDDDEPASAKTNGTVRQVLELDHFVTQPVESNQLDKPIPEVIVDAHVLVPDSADDTLHVPKNAIKSSSSEGNDIDTTVTSDGKVTILSDEVSNGIDAQDKTEIDLGSDASDNNNTNSADAEMLPTGKTITDDETQPGKESEINVETTVKDAIKMRETEGEAIIGNADDIDKRQGEEDEDDDAESADVVKVADDDATVVVDVEAPTDAAEDDFKVEIRPSRPVEEEMPHEELAVPVFTAETGKGTDQNAETELETITKLEPVETAKLSVSIENESEEQGTEIEELEKDHETDAEIRQENGSSLDEILATTALRRVKRETEIDIKEGEMEVEQVSLEDGSMEITLSANVAKDSGDAEIKIEVGSPKDDVRIKEIQNDDNQQAPKETQNPLKEAENQTEDENPAPALGMPGDSAVEAETVVQTELPIDEEPLIQRTAIIRELPQIPDLDKYQAEFRMETETQESIKPTAEPNVLVESVAESEVSTEPLAEAEVSIEPAAEIAVAIDPEVETEVSIEPLAQAQVSIEPIAETEVLIEHVAETEISREPLAEAEVSIEPLAKAEVSIEPVVETDVSIEPLAQAQVSIEPVVEAEILIEPVAEAEVSSEPLAEAEVATEPVAESEAELAIHSANDKPIEPIAEAEITFQSPSNIAIEPTAEVEIETKAESKIIPDILTDNSVEPAVEADPSNESKTEAGSSIESVAKDETAIQDESGIANESIPQVSKAETGTPMEPVIQTGISNELTTEVHIPNVPLSETDVSSELPAEAETIIQTRDGKPIEPTAEDKSGDVAEPESLTEFQVQEKANAQAEPEVNNETKVQVEPEINNETKVKVEPEINSETKVQAEPESQNDLKPDAEAEISKKPEPRAQSELEVNDETEMQSKAENDKSEIQAEPDNEMAPEVKTETEKEMKPTTATEIQNDLEQMPVVDGDTSKHADAEDKNEPKSRLIPEKEIGPETDKSAEPATLPEVENRERTEPEIPPETGSSEDQQINVGIKNDEPEVIPETQIEAQTERDALPQTETITESNAISESESENEMKSGAAAEVIQVNGETQSESEKQNTLQTEAESKMPSESEEPNEMETENDRQAKTEMQIEIDPSKQVETELENLSEMQAENVQQLKQTANADQDETESPTENKENEPSTQAKTEIQSKSDLMPENGAQVETDTEAETGAQVKTESQAETGQVETTTEAETGAQVETDTEAETAERTNAKAEAEPAEQTETKAETETEEQTETNVETKTEQQVELENEAMVQIETQTDNRQAINAKSTEMHGKVSRAVDGTESKSLPQAKTENENDTGVLNREVFSMEVHPEISAPEVTAQQNQKSEDETTDNGADTASRNTMQAELNDKPETSDDQKVETEVNSATTNANVTEGRQSEMELGLENGDDIDQETGEKCDMKNTKFVIVPAETSIKKDGDDKTTVSNDALMEDTHQIGTATTAEEQQPQLTTSQNTNQTTATGFGGPLQSAGHEEVNTEYLMDTSQSSKSNRENKSRTMEEGKMNLVASIENDEMNKHLDITSQGLHADDNNIISVQEADKNAVTLSAESNHNGALAANVGSKLNVEGKDEDTRLSDKNTVTTMDPNNRHE